jgi:hypothetical protein
VVEIKRGQSFFFPGYCRHGGVTYDWEQGKWHPAIHLNLCSSHHGVKGDTVDFDAAYGQVYLPVEHVPYLTNPQKRAIFPKLLAMVKALVLDELKLNRTGLLSDLDKCSSKIYDKIAGVVTDADAKAKAYSIFGELNRQEEEKEEQSASNGSSGEEDNRKLPAVVNVNLETDMSTDNGLEKLSEACDGAPDLATGTYAMVAAPAPNEAKRKSPPPASPDSGKPKRPKRNKQPPSKFTPSEYDQNKKGTEEESEEEESEEEESEEEQFEARIF